MVSGREGWSMRTLSPGTTGVPALCTPAHADARLNKTSELRYRSTQSPWWCSVISLKKSERDSFHDHPATPDVQRGVRIRFWRLGFSVLPRGVDVKEARRRIDH